MKLFIWDNVDNATNRYHADGGVVVIAETLERAREILLASAPACEAKTKKPDLVRECAGPEHVSIHPNSGCCDGKISVVDQRKE